MNRIERSTPTWIAMVAFALGACGRVGFQDRPPDAVTGAPALAVVAGYDYTCALRVDRSVWCWGDDTYGELGDGGGAARSTPAQVQGLPTDVAQLVGGFGTVCVVTTAGSAWCWGQDAIAGAPYPQPTHVLDDVAAISYDVLDACALLVDGEVDCWGENIGNELGHLGHDIGAATAVGAGNLEVVEGDKHTCVLAADRSVQCFGVDDFCQLGDQGCPTLGSSGPVTGVPPAAHLAASGDITCLVATDGSVWCWGTGYLGDGAGLEITTPVRVAVSGATALYGGPGSGWFCAQVAAGLACWGLDIFGRLGDRTTTLADIPVTNLDATGLSGFALGYEHGCGLDAASEVWCWGSNLHGQLGEPAATSSSMFTTLPTVANATAITGAPASDALHMCAIAGGQVACWGDNTSGQLGGATTATNIPMVVAGLASIDQLALGRAHSCARQSDGTVWCWGSNANGQLGDGTTTDRAQPLAISAAGDVAQIAAGAIATDAERTDGTLWVWGDDSAAELGLGAVGPAVLVPTQTPLAGLTGIAAAEQLACGLLGGGVECWGLGAIDGSTSTPTPTAPSGLPASASALTTTAARGACVRAPDASAWCWGNTAFGANPVPMQVLPAGTVGELVLGENAACLIDHATGALSCLGSVDVTAPTTTTFQPVSGAPPAAQVALTGNAICVLGIDGTIACRGDNTYGLAGLPPPFTLTPVLQLVGF